MVGGERSRATGTLEEEGLVRQVGRHAERVLEERDRMRVGAQGGGPLGSGSQGDAGLGGDGVGLGTLGRVPVGGEVVAGKGAGSLIGPEALEEAGRGEVAGLAVAPGERVVGDLADERLDERVLARARGARVGLEGQELASDEERRRGSSSAPGCRSPRRGRRG